MHSKTGKTCQIKSKMDHIFSPSGVRTDCIMKHTSKENVAEVGFEPTT